MKVKIILPRKSPLTEWEVLLKIVAIACTPQADTKRRK